MWVNEMKDEKQRNRWNRRNPSVDLERLKICFGAYLMTYWKNEMKLPDGEEVNW